MVGACALLPLLAACGGGGPAPTPTPSPSPTPSDDRFFLASLVHDAEPGATVLVPAGTYHEQVELQKPVTFKPAGDGPVIIDGDCKREAGISVTTGHDITVSGITIRNTVGPGVRIGNGPDDVPLAQDITLDSLTITDFNCNDAEEQYASGIAAWYSGSGITITNNTITYRSSGDQLGHGNGIWFKSNTERPNGGGHYISGNTITGGYDGIGGETEWDPHGSFDQDTVIENNTISTCWDDGIQVEGGTKNVRVRNNVITACGAGIAFAAPVTGPLYIEANTITDLVTGELGGLYCFKVGNPGEGITYLTNNVCKTSGDGISQTNVDLAPIISRGNCFNVSRYALELHGPFDGSSFEGDYIWSTNEEGFLNWEDVVYDDLALFQRDTGQEAGAQITEDCPISSG